MPAGSNWLQCKHFQNAQPTECNAEHASKSIRPMDPKFRLACNFMQTNADLHWPMRSHEVLGYAYSLSYEFLVIGLEPLRRCFLSSFTLLWALTIQLSVWFPYKRLSTKQYRTDGALTFDIISCHVYPVYPVSSAFGMAGAESTLRHSFWFDFWRWTATHFLFKNWLCSTVALALMWWPKHILTTFIRRPQLAWRWISCSWCHACPWLHFCFCQRLECGWLPYFYHSLRKHTDEQEQKLGRPTPY